MFQEIKKNIKLIIVIIIIVCIFGWGSSYAATTYAIHSENVEYKDSSNNTITNVQAAINGTCTKFSNQLTTLESTIIDKIYPVGSIYISETDSTATAVQNRFGGTWVAYGSGKTLIGAGTGKDANGTSQTFSVSNNSSNLGEYKHTLTKAQLPSISGTITAGAGNDGSTAGGHGGFRSATGVFSVANVREVGQPKEATKWAGDYNGYASVKLSIGNNEAHNNVQPYITVYMYKRTA